MGGLLGGFEDGELNLGGALEFTALRDVRSGDDDGLDALRLSG